MNEKNRKERYVRIGPEDADEWLKVVQIVADEANKISKTKEEFIENITKLSNGSDTQAKRRIEVLCDYCPEVIELKKTETNGRTHIKEVERKMTELEKQSYIQFGHDFLKENNLLEKEWKSIWSIEPSDINVFCRIYYKGGKRK